MNEQRSLIRVFRRGRSLHTLLTAIGLTLIAAPLFARGPEDAAGTAAESPAPKDIQANPNLYRDAGPTTKAHAQLGGTEADERIRQGTELVDQPGHFRMTGDRITFFTKMGKGRFVVLENLALDRVARVIEDNPQELRWLVDGMMTEYQGVNYLLIQRAVLESQVADDEPIF